MFSVVEFEIGPVHNQMISLQILCKILMRKSSSYLESLITHFAYCIMYQCTKIFCQLNFAFDVLSLFCKKKRLEYLLLVLECFWIIWMEGLVFISSFICSISWNWLHIFLRQIQILKTTFLRWKHVMPIPIYFIWLVSYDIVTGHVTLTGALWC